MPKPDIIIVVFLKISLYLFTYTHNKYTVYIIYFIRYLINPLEKSLARISRPLRKLKKTEERKKTLNVWCIVTMTTDFFLLLSSQALNLDKDSH